MTEQALRIVVFVSILFIFELGLLINRRGK